MIYILRQIKPLCYVPSLQNSATLIFLLRRMDAFLPDMHRVTHSASMLHALVCCTVTSILFGLLGGLVARRSFSGGRR